MAFDNLTEKLNNVFKKLSGKGKVSEADVKEAMKMVKLALLEADVNFKVVKNFINNATEKAIGSQVLESLTPAQQVIKIVNEELTELMGKEAYKPVIAPKAPSIYMLMGLQGAGKTTTCAKIASYFIKNGKKTLLVACDVYRPAAIEQLKVVGSKVGSEVYTLDIKEPVRIADDAVKYARNNNIDVVIIDTAGRLHIDEALMDELKNIRDTVNPTELYLTLDSMTGQDAVNVAKTFNEMLDITGVILTKLDGDTRGGAALSVKAVTGRPIKFSGIGEKLEDLEAFHPDRMASRILGMGDVLTLIEEAEQKLDAKKAEQLADKMLKNKMDFNDLLDQFDQIRNLGPIKGILSKLPGIGNKLDDVDIDDRQLDWSKAIILSMTKEERAKPSLINPSRKKRIAAGSGRSVEEVNRLIKQLEQTQKMMKQFTQRGKKGRRMRNLPGLGGPMDMGGPGGFPGF